MNNERGTILVWITLMIVLLLFMVGMGLDTGQLVFTRSTGQAAVDAAALAAVSALPTRDAATIQARATAAYLAANTYTGSAKNPIAAKNVTYVDYNFGSNTITNYNAPLATANGVRVALEQSAGSAISTPTFLTPLMNLMGASVSGTQNVSVSAVSVINARPSIPIALWQSVCKGTTTIKDVEIAQQNQSDENSCWTTYLDKSSGASDIKALFTAGESCTGLPMGVDIGTPIYENKGQAASVYGVAEDFFLKNATTKNRDWLIPVIVGSGNCNAKDPSPIVDWAKIRVTAVSKHGSHSYIQADITCNQTLDGSLSSLCFSHRLVRESAKGM